MRKGALLLGILYLLWSIWQYFTVVNVLSLYQEFNARIPPASFLVPALIFTIAVILLGGYFANFKNQILYKILVILGILGIIIYLLYIFIGGSIANRRVYQMLNEYDRSINDRSINTNDFKPDYSANRTIKQEGKSVTIDFGQCTEDIRRIDVGFGSTTIAIGGKEGTICRVYYGGEVENPNWDGNLPGTCKVPISLGKVSFSTTNYGVNFSPIQDYCVK